MPVRSVIKITLGIEFIAGLILGVTAILFSIVVAIHSIPVINEFTNLFKDFDQQSILFTSGMIAVFGIIEFISVVIVKLIATKLDTIDRKYKFIPLMLLQFISLKWISLIMIICTPSKYLIYKNPYFI